MVGATFDDPEEDDNDVEHGIIKSKKGMIYIFIPTSVYSFFDKIYPDKHKGREPTVPLQPLPCAHSSQHWSAMTSATTLGETDYSLTR